MTNMQSRYISNLFHFLHDYRNTHTLFFYKLRIHLFIVTGDHLLIKASGNFDIVRTTGIRVSFFVGGNLGRKSEPVHCSRRYKEWFPESADVNALNAHFSSSATFRFDIPPFKHSTFLGQEESGTGFRTCYQISRLVNHLSSPLFRAFVPPSFHFQTREFLLSKIKRIILSPLCEHVVQTSTE